MPKGSIKLDDSELLEDTEGKRRTLGAVRDGVGVAVRRVLPTPDVVAKAPSKRSFTYWKRRGKASYQRCTHAKTFACLVVVVVCGFFVAVFAWRAVYSAPIPNEITLHAHVLPAEPEPALYGSRLEAFAPDFTNTLKNETADNYRLLVLTQAAIRWKSTGGASLVQSGEVDIFWTITSKWGRDEPRSQGDILLKMIEVLADWNSPLMQLGRVTKLKILCERPVDGKGCRARRSWPVCPPLETEARTDMTCTNGLFGPEVYTAACHVYCANGTIVEGTGSNSNQTVYGSSLATPITRVCNISGQWDGQDSLSCVPAPASNTTSDANATATPL